MNISSIAQTKMDKEEKLFFQTLGTIAYVMAATFAICELMTYEPKIENNIIIPRNIEKVVQDSSKEILIKNDSTIYNPYKILKNEK